MSRQKPNKAIIDVEATKVTSERNIVEVEPQAKEKILNNTATEVAATSIDNPFDDISKLRLNQNSLNNVAVKKVLTTLRVEKPNKEAFIRTHPNADYWIETQIIELKTDREIYLVSPDLWPELEGEPTFTKKVLITSIDRQGVIFIWPIKLPDSNGKLDDWNKSALEGANLAKDYWVRVKANMSLGAYDIDQAIADWGNPEWPEMPFNEMLKIAFKDKFIDSFDHPVLRRLRGEI